MSKRNRKPRSKKHNYNVAPEKRASTSRWIEGLAVADESLSAHDGYVDRNLHAVAGFSDRFSRCLYTARSGLQTALLLAIAISR